MASYYILNRESLAPFLPFLSPADRQAAEHGTLRVIGAVEAETAVGAAAFSKVGDEAVLHSIAVSPDYQRQWIATDMIRYLCSVLPALDCFSLTVSLAPNHPAEAMMKKIMEGQGGRMTDGPQMISCPIAALRKSPLLQPLLQAQSKKVVPMNEVPGVCLREFGTSLMHNGTISVPMDWDTFDPQLSFFGLTEKQEVSCCICAVRDGEGISVEWIYTTLSGSKDLVMAVVELLQVCETVCPPDARFSAVLIDDKAQKLLAGLAGDAVEYHAAPRWEIAL